MGISVFLHHPPFVFSPPALPLDQRMWNHLTFLHSVPLLPLSSLLLHRSCLGRSASHFSESTIHGQYYTPPPFPIETLTPIILSPLFVLAWDRWPLSQLIWPCLCCKRGSGCGCYALLTAIFYPSFTLSDDDERAVLEDYQTKMSVTTLHNNRSSNKSLTVFTIFHVI